MPSDGTLNYNVEPITIDIKELNVFPYGSFVISQVENINLKISPDPKILPRVTFTAYMCTSGLVNTFLKKIEICVDTDGNNQTVDFPLPIANCEAVTIAVVAKAVAVLEAEESKEE